MNLTLFLRSKTLRGLVSIASLIIMAALIHGCGENPLPPAGPTQKGIVIVTGAAV